MTWPEALQAAINEFADVFDPMERYEMLFEWAAEVNELSESCLLYTSPSPRDA